VIGQEKAWDHGGGGFSNHFPIPSFQRDAVEHYKKTAAAAGILPDQKLWNASGRGYPDVAALGGSQNSYCVSLTGILGRRSMMGIAGTSASCPVVAGIFARLNALRAAKGLSPMGWLNPFIYQNAAAFNDVTLGQNSGEGSRGFKAIAGWDPATGFGTPNFPKAGPTMAAWLKQHEVANCSHPTADMIECSIDVQTAEKMFRTTLGHFVSGLTFFALGS